MMRIHGHEVIGYLARETQGEAVILVDRGAGTHDRYVTGMIRSDDMDPREWFWGHYFDSRDKAVRDMLLRARTNLLIEVPKPEYCEGCERPKSEAGSLTSKGYCRDCVASARDAGYLSFVQ